MRIGIVLPRLPGYSETFFKSKLAGLVKHENEVILFVNSSDVRVKMHMNCEVKYAIRLPASNLGRAIQSIISLTYVMYRNASSARKLYNFHRQNHEGVLDCIRKIILNAHILSEKLDWLHFGYATMGIGREFVGKSIGAKTALSLRGYDIGIFPLKKPHIYKVLFSQIDKVHTISDDLLHKAYKYGLPSNVSVRKITPAIDYKQFSKNTAREISIESPIKILTVGRLHWKKGGDLLLQALKILKANKIDYTFVWAGDGSELERLAFAAHQYEITKNITFTGQLRHLDVAELMAESHIYIQYSLQEGFCNAVLEAQASGLLTIVSDADGLSENVIDDITGWVVEKNDPLLLARTIVYVSKLPHEIQSKIRKNAIERIKENFSISRQQELFLDFYRK